MFMRKFIIEKLSYAVCLWFRFHFTYKFTLRTIPRTSDRMFPDYTSGKNSGQKANVTPVHTHE